MVNKFERPQEPNVNSEGGATLLTDDVKAKVQEALNFPPSNYTKIHSGKVRDTYDYPGNPDKLIIIATDRVSTHDVVHTNTVPGKGEVLTQISNFWFSHFKSHPKTKHIQTQQVEGAEIPSDFPSELANRTIIVKKLDPIPVEAIVRGYLYGSAYKGKNGSYNPETGTLATGEFVGKDLTKCSQFPEPLFTPSTKGKEDININYETMVQHIDEWLQSNNRPGDARQIAETVKEYSIALYQTANEYAENKGIILGDTKFEFALDKEGNVVLIDEVCTPDSSRFWKKETVVPGEEPESYDKQPLREEAVALWEKMGDKTKKTPLTFSDEAVKNTQLRYEKMRQIFS